VNISISTALSRVLEAQKPRPTCKMCSGLMAPVIDVLAIVFLTSQV
jgi:hypothetical protein